MTIQEFRGFGGVTLRAEISGISDDPPVLLVHGAQQSAQVWREVAAALVQAGRQVINLDLRGHGASDMAPDGRYDFDVFVEDLRAVLAQLAARPVIVGATIGGWMAAVAIGEQGGHLASGLVLADAPPQIDADAARDIGASSHLPQSGEAASRAHCDPRFPSAKDLQASAARIATACRDIALPMLYVRGAFSKLTEADGPAVFVDGQDNAEVAEIRDGETLVAFDRADVFNATLLEFLERRVPRFLPDYRQGSDARTLRDALGCFATGVTVVTAMSDDGEPVGLTANSFTSVSLDPPLLLVCIAKTSGSLKVIEAASHFAINVLHIGQQPVSNAFARPGADRFASTPWQRGQYDVPLIAGAMANFECGHHALHDGGDHVILVGQVERAKYEPRRDPLLYFKGRYRRLHFA